MISSHVTAPTASYSLVGSDMCSTPEFSAFYSLFQVTSIKRHFRVTLRHPGSRDVISSHVTPPTVSYSLVASDMSSICNFSAFYSHFQITSGQTTSLSVTSDHERSRNVISFHVTASYCVPQLCRK